MEVDDYQVVNRKMRLDILDVGHVIYSEDCQMAFLIPAKKWKKKNLVWVISMYLKRQTYIS